MDKTAPSKRETFPSFSVLARNLILTLPSQPLLSRLRSSALQTRSPLSPPPLPTCKLSTSPPLPTLSSPSPSYSSPTASPSATLTSQPRPSPPPRSRPCRRSSRRATLRAGWRRPSSSGCAAQDRVGRRIGPRWRGCGRQACSRELRWRSWPGLEGGDYRCGRVWRAR